MDTSINSFWTIDFNRDTIKDLFREVIRDELKKLGVNPNRLHDIKSIADYLQVSVKAIRIYIAENNMPFHRLNNKKLYFFENEVAEWLKGYKSLSTGQLQEPWQIAIRRFLK